MIGHFSGFKSLENHHYYIYKYFEKHRHIHDQHYEFHKKKHSRVNFPNFIIHYQNKSLTFHDESRVVGLNSSNAFHKGWFRALVNKLLSYGFHSKFCDWIRSFFFNRSIYMYVIVYAYSSFMHKIIARFRQRSFIASTVFLLYINALIYVTFYRHPTQSLDMHFWIQLSIQTLL